MLTVVDGKISRNKFWYKFVLIFCASPFILYRMKYLRDQEGLDRFGERLRQIRQEKGLTQEDLGAKMGMEFNQIGRVERGVINSSLSMVFTLAKALEVDVRELFDFSSLPI